VALTPRTWWRLGLGLAAGLGALAIAGTLYVHTPIPAARLAHVGSLELLDRTGRPLRILPLPTGGRAYFRPLAQLPASVVLTTLAGEGDRFLDHDGVDARAVFRALWLNARERRVVSGASTLSMQVARLLEPRPRTLLAKVSEATMALRLERTLGKDGLLEQYLNRANYGHGAIGVEAAARTYFGKSAALLTFAEGSLLAILPRAPSAYDPHRHLPAALARRSHVLGLLERRGRITATERAATEATPLHLVAPQPPVHEAPHFVDWLLRGRELPPGGPVRTTLDLELQRQMERAVRENLATRAERGLEQAGVVILEPSTGAVLAMVGSADYFAPAGGQLNVTTTPRHPGSALKPFIYALALTAGDSPATLALDVADVTNLPSRFRPDRAMREHGPVRYRESLASSYNWSAVRVLERVGVGKLLDLLRRTELGPLPGSAETYGPALALGAARVRLLDLAAAYAFLVNAGVTVPPRGLEATTTSLSASPRRLFSPEVSWLVMDMLADPGARRAAFGAELPVDLPFPVAIKTGTSAGYSDTVAIGTTREAVVAAWAGAFDGSGTKGALAMWSAAPLVRAGLRAVSAGVPLTLPPRPETLTTVDICPLSGARPGPDCPHKTEHFVAGTEPQIPCAMHARDPVTGELAAILPRTLRGYHPPRLRVIGRRR
jgi:penicillin-binding protein 1C